MQPGVHQLTPLLYTRRRKGNSPALTKLLAEGSSKSLLDAPEHESLPKKEPEPEPTLERVPSADHPSVSKGVVRRTSLVAAQDALALSQALAQTLLLQNSSEGSFKNPVALAPLDHVSKNTRFGSDTPDDSPTFSRSGTMDLQARLQKRRASQEENEEESKELVRPNTSMGNMELPSLAAYKLTDPLSLSHSSLPLRPNTSLGFSRSLNDMSRSLSQSSETPIVSSWNPRNFQLHWHQDLTEQAPDGLPSWIWQRQNLRVLLVGGNRLPSIPPEIGLLHNLNEFVAFNNRITHIPPEIFTLAMLQKLDLSFNLLHSVPDEIVELTELREIKLGHNRLTRIPDVLVNVGMMHVELLDLSHNRLVELPRHLHNVNTLQFLDVSHNQISSLPGQFRLLERLEVLDVSHNCLESLPINELKLMLIGRNGREPALHCIECCGNPHLTRPPPEINEQGGRSVALYLRASVRSDEELENTDMVMVVYGERGAGKTSMIQALSARSNRSRPIRRIGISHGVEFSTWGANPDLGFQVIELTAQTALSSNMLQLFLVRRSIYVLVWAAVQCIDGALPEWEAVHLRRIVNDWIDAIQHAVPGASVLFVATHIDQVSAEELQHQTDLIHTTAQARIQLHRKTMEKRDVSRQMPILNICKDGRSFEVDSLKGKGVVDLRNAVMSFTKSTPWYGESIPTAYMCLRDALSKLAKNGRKVWMSWREYRDLARKSGIKGQDHLRIATSFLNEIGILRFFGDVGMAQAAEKQQPSEKLEVLNSVYISLEWVVDVMKGLFQSDRGALLDFFSRGRYKDKQMYLRVRRLLTRGIVHPTLAPFLWPLVPEWPHAKDEAIQAWWTEARAQGLYEDKLICSDEAGLRRVLHLVEGLDIGAITQEEGELSKSLGGQEEWLVPPLVVPGLLSDQHRLPLDARVFSDACLYRIDVEYLTLPPGFFNKLLVSLRRQADHIDFNTRAAALYAMGTKLQVFMARREDDATSSSCVTALFSSSQLWKPFKNVLEGVEHLFPGLHRIAFNYRIFADIHDEMEESLSLHSSLSRDSLGSHAGDVPLSPLLSPVAVGRRRGRSDRRRSSVAAADLERLTQSGRRASVSRTKSSSDGLGRSASSWNPQTLLDAGIADRRGSTTLETPLLSLELSLDRDDMVKAKVHALEQTIAFLHNPTQVLVLHSIGATNVGMAAMAAIKALDPTLEVQRRTPNDAADPEDKPLLMVLLVDKEIARNPRGIAAVREHVGAKRSIIPMLVPGYEHNKERWWPDTMPELERFGPFEDVRYREEWLELEWKDSREKYYKLRPQMLEQLIRMSHTGDSWAIKERAYAIGGQQHVEADVRKERMKNIHHRARMTLRDWRGEPPAEGIAVADVSKGVQKIPCLECIRTGEERPATFDRAECLRVLEEAFSRSRSTAERVPSEGEQQGDGLLVPANPWKVLRPANTKVTPWVTCAFGHLLGAAEVLESASRGVYDSVTCPICMRNGTSPPWCFNRNECLAFFRAEIDTFPGLEVQDEHKDGLHSLSASLQRRQGRRMSQSLDRTESAGSNSTSHTAKEKELPKAMTATERASAVLRCPKCTAHGLQGPRLLDVLSPEVFLSYSAGREIRDDHGEKKFATEQLVKEMRGYLEEAADVLCWMDEGSDHRSLDASLSHSDQMELGIDKAVVVVAFLSDEYIRSDKCRLELHRALIKGKYILPVLVAPVDVLDEGGWSGTDEGNQWWEHAKKILSGELVRGGSVEPDSIDHLFKSEKGASNNPLISRTSSVPPRFGTPEEVDWEGLSAYQPVDMRRMDRENVEQDIAKRVLGRFHRATQVKKQAERARQVWRRIKMVKSFWAFERDERAAAAARSPGFGLIASPGSGIESPGGGGNFS